MVTNILILDEKVTSHITHCHGVSSDDADCVDGPTIPDLATDSHTCVGREEHKVAAAHQQVESGRSGGSSDCVNSAGGNKGSGSCKVYYSGLHS